MKTSTCRDGKTSQTRWERHCNTFTPSLHLVPFCQLCTTQNSTLNKHGTQHYSLHSLPYKRQSISATFSSNKISQHKVKTPNIPYRPSTAHSFCIQDKLYIPPMLSSNYIASTHNITHSPWKSTCMHYTPNNTFPTAFYNPPIHTITKQWHKM